MSQLEENDVPEAPEQCTTAATQAPEEAAASSPSWDWEREARLIQQQFLHFIGDRDYDSFRRKLPSICNLLLTDYCKCLESEDLLCLNDAEMIILKMKIGFALFGKPKAIPNSVNLTGYDAYHMNCIMKIFNKIVSGQEHDRVLMAPVFVLLEGKGESISQFPVFRIPSQKNKEDFWFVDHLGRLYKSWGGYLKNNKLPASKWCYPQDGIYSSNSEGNVQICFGFTPPAKLSGKILNVTDTASSIVGLGAGVGTFFPPVALASIFVGGAIGVYGIVRGSIELADRGKHGESLKDREAFRHWLSVAGCSLGLGSAGGAVMVRWLAQGGRELSCLAAFTVNGISGSSLLVNGVGIAESLWTLIEQEKLSSLQCFQFVASVIFFAHSAVTIKTARSLFVETQNQIIQDHKAGLRSNKHRKLFDNIQKETLKGEDVLVGKAKIIRDLNHMSNKNEFYARVVRSNKVAKKNSLPTEKVKFGELSTENTGQTSSLGLSPRLAAGNINQVCFQGNVKEDGFATKLIYKEPTLLFNIRNALQNVTNSIELSRLFAILDMVCSKFLYGKYFMRALRIVVDCYDCKTVNDAKRIIEDIIQIVREIFEEMVNSVKNADGEHSEMEIDEETNGIHEEKEVHSSDKIMHDVVTDVEFIPNLLHMVETGEVVYHFPADHREWGPHGELTQEDYILIGKNALGIANVECANIIHEGDTANVHFQHIGFVTITSYVKEQKIVVKTKSFQDSFE